MSRIIECLNPNDAGLDSSKNETTPAENWLVCEVFVNEKGEFLLKDGAFKESCDKESYGFPTETILPGETPKEALLRHAKEDFNVSLDEGSVKNAGEIAIKHPDRTDNMHILVCGLTSNTRIEGYGENKWWCNMGKIGDDLLLFETQQVLGKLVNEEARCLAIKQNKIK